MCKRIIRFVSAALSSSPQMSCFAPRKEEGNSHKKVQNSQNTGQAQDPGSALLEIRALKACDFECPRIDNHPIIASGRLDAQQSNTFPSEGTSKVFLVMIRRAGLSRPYGTPGRLLSTLFDFQVVGDVEGHHASAHLSFGDLLFHRVSNHARQGYLAVLHDNVDRRICLNPLCCEHRIAIVGVGSGPAVLSTVSRE